MTPPPAIKTVISATLLDTHWRLTRLGELVVDNPVGANAVHVSMQSQNTNVTGNSGCNRMFGRYALENDMLKFDGLGGTKMFCEARMELEQKFTNALMSVMRWKITGTTLVLLDDQNIAVATFEASPATG
jgi:putative lipoprotein